VQLSLEACCKSTVPRNIRLSLDASMPFEQRRIYDGSPKAHAALALPRAHMSTASMTGSPLPRATLGVPSGF
jgi:hypothetical protein